MRIRKKARIGGRGAELEPTWGPVVGVSVIGQIPWKGPETVRSAWRGLLVSTCRNNRREGSSIALGNGRN